MKKKLSYLEYVQKMSDQFVQRVSIIVCQESVVMLLQCRWANLSLLYFNQS